MNERKKDADHRFSDRTISSLISIFLNIQY